MIQDLFKPYKASHRRGIKCSRACLDEEEELGTISLEESHLLVIDGNHLRNFADRVLEVCNREGIKQSERSAVSKVSREWIRDNLYSPFVGSEDSNFNQINDTASQSPSSNQTLTTFFPVGSSGGELPQNMGGVLLVPTGKTQLQHQPQTPQI